MTRPAAVEISDDLPEVPEDAPETAEALPGPEGPVARIKRDLDGQIARMDDELRDAVAERDRAQKMVTRLREGRAELVAARARMEGRKRKAR